MKYGAAIALILAALPLSALAQHGFAQGGSFGGRAIGGRAGFSARPGFSAPRTFAPSPSFRFGPLGPPPAVRFNPPHIPTPGFAGNGNNFMASRPAYRPGFAGRSSYWDHNGDRDRDHDGDRDRFRDRARLFQNWYAFGYPGSLEYGYPYYFDPGFYDLWDQAVYGEDDQSSGNSGQGYGYQSENPNGDYSEPGGGYYGQPDSGSYGEPGDEPPPWPEPGTSQAAPGGNFSVSGLATASAPPLEGPLTVIFKSGRAPETMQNYMLTSKALTDLDPDHYQQIPLDQINLSATAQANRSKGVDFQVPGAARD